MLKRLLRQYNLPWIGGVKVVLGQTIFYFSVINFILIAITAYHTTLRDFFLVHVPWVKFWMFMLVLAVLIFILMFLEYKFIMASHFSFQSKQLFEHQSKVMDKLNEIEKILAEKEKK